MMDDPRLRLLLERAAADDGVLAVMLYGSAARGDNTRFSDIDVCLLLQDRRADRAEMARKRLDYADLDLDVQVFQLLPLYVRSRVLKEGRTLFVRDEDALYELAFRTVRAFEDFKPRYRAYLDEVLHAGS
jgi:predicted nucleotidyltransferase